MTWYVFALLAALFFGIYFLLFYRYIHREHAIEYLAVFSIFVVLFSFPLVKEISFNLTHFTWFLVYLVSLLLTVFFYFIASSLKHLESSEVAPLTNVSLLFIVLFSVFLFGEKLSWGSIFGIGLMIVGSYILEVGVKIETLKRLFKQLRKKYILYTGMATLAASTMILLEKILLNPEILNVPIEPLTPFSLYFLSRAGMALNFMIILLFKRRSFRGFNHALNTMLLPILITAIVNIAANVSHYMALQRGYVSLVAPITSLSTLIVVIIGGELFHEHKLQQKIIAAVMMILAVYIILA